MGTCAKRVKPEQLVSEIWLNEMRVKMIGLQYLSLVKEPKIVL